MTSFPGGSSGNKKKTENTKQKPACKAGDIRNMGSLLKLRKSLGGEHSKPLQYSCLENPMDRGAWRATVYRVTKGQTQLKQLGTHACMLKYIIGETNKNWNNQGKLPVILMERNQFYFSNIWVLYVEKFCFLKQHGVSYNRAGSQYYVQSC